MIARRLSIREVGLIVVLLVGTASAPAHAQLTIGALHGTVLDQTGAALPGATVTATSVATGRARSTTTTGFGDFRMALLEPGVYAVRAELSGFRTQEFAQIRVEQGGVATLTFNFCETSGCGVCIEVCPWSEQDAGPKLSERLLETRASRGGR